MEIGGALQFTQSIGGYPRVRDLAKPFRSVIDEIADVGNWERAKVENRDALLCPNISLIGIYAELEVGPGFEGFQPGADAADGGEADEGIVDQICWDVPRFELEREGFGKFKFAMGADILAVANDGECALGAVVGQGPIK
jgi:hypothetical protein